MQWTLVIPLKPLVRAKSRLSDTADDTVRPGLALAFAQDTVAAVAACTRVRDVAVVTDDARASRELAALGARIVPDTPAAGLNAALAHAANVLRAERPGTALATLNADLPALRSAELARVLTAADEFPRAFLPDAAGIGTTLLSARPGTALRPAFGGASRARHTASGAVELTPPGVDSVRLDVDTGDDLRAALALGVGPRTAAVAARVLMRDAADPADVASRRFAYPALVQATAYTYDPATRSGSVLLDDGTPVPFGAAAFDAGGLRLLRPGQRVRIEIAEGGSGDGIGDDENPGAGPRITLVTLQTL